MTIGKSPSLLVVFLFVLFLGSVWYADNNRLDMTIFFMKLFNAPLDGTQINFYIVQGYWSEEIYVPLKRVGQVCSTIINLDHCKDKK